MIVKAHNRTWLSKMHVCTCLLWLYHMSYDLHTPNTGAATILSLHKTKNEIRNTIKHTCCQDWDVQAQDWVPGPRLIYKSENQKHNSITDWLKNHGIHTAPMPYDVLGHRVTPTRHGNLHVQKLPDDIVRCPCVVRCRAQCEHRLIEWCAAMKMMI